MIEFHSFLCLSNIVCVCVYIYICIYIYHIFFIHSSLHGHLHYFCILAIVNDVAMNIGTPTFSNQCFLFYLNKYSEMELLDHAVVVLLIFKEISILFSIVAEPIYIPTNSADGSFFSTPSLTLAIILIKAILIGVW